MIVSGPWATSALSPTALSCESPGGDAGAFSEKAKREHNLLVVPADGFGCPGYFRLSYCVSNEMIRRSLPAFKAMMEAYQ